MLRNDGQGGFEGTRVSEAQAVFFVALGDLDNDGDIDLAWVEDLKVIVVMHNQGDGVFRDADAYEPSGDPFSVFGIFVGDADLDGDLDLFTAHNQARKFEVFLNDGRGTFQNREVIEIYDPSVRLQTTTYILDMGDIDSDGDQDVIMSATEPHQVFVLRNTSVR